MWRLSNNVNRNSKLINNNLVKTNSRRGFASESNKNYHIESKPNTFVNICPHGYVIMRERLGKLYSMEKPGLFLAIPIIDNLRYKVNLRELCIQISPQSAITKDNVSVDIGGALYVQIKDAVKACYEIENVLLAVKMHGISSMRSAIGCVELDELLHNRQKLNDKLRGDLQNAANKWGIEVTRYELTEIHPDKEVSKAMDSQATAERKKRETILNASALREKLILESEGEQQKMINIANAHMQEVQLAAKAEKESKILFAEGEKQKSILFAEAEKIKQETEAVGRANALTTLAQALNTPTGEAAMNYDMAQKYVNTISAGLQKTSTVFLNDSVTNIPALMAKGTSIISQMMSQQEYKKIE